MVEARLLLQRRYGLHTGGFVCIVEARCAQQIWEARCLHSRGSWRPGVPSLASDAFMYSSKVVFGFTNQRRFYVFFQSSDLLTSDAFMYSSRVRIYQLATLLCILLEFGFTNQRRFYVFFQSSDSPDSDTFMYSSRVRIHQLKTLLCILLEFGFTSQRRFMYSSRLRIHQLAMLLSIILEFGFTNQQNFFLLIEFVFTFTIKRCFYFYSFWSSDSSTSDALLRFLKFGFTNYIGAFISPSRVRI